MVELVKAVGSDRWNEKQRRSPRGDFDIRKPQRRNEWTVCRCGRQDDRNERLRDGAKTAATHLGCESGERHTCGVKRTYVYSSRGEPPTVNGADPDFAQRRRGRRGARRRGYARRDNNSGGIMVSCASWKQDSLEYEDGPQSQH